MEDKNESHQSMSAQQDFDQFDAAFAEEEDVVQDDVFQNPEPEPAQVEIEPQNEPESEILPTPEPEAKEQEDSGNWQHKYDSMMGRLNKAQNENADLRQQMAAMQAQLQQLQAKPVEAPKQEEALPEIEGLEAIPDELLPLFKENSKDGNRVRKVLEEYGPEHATMAAESLMTRRHTESAQAEWQKEREADKLAAHKARLSMDHPEYAAAFNGNAEKFNELFSGVSAWIDVLPYSKGREMARIAQSGTTAEVSAMLAEYKQFRSAPQKTAAVQSLAKSNLAVPAGKAPQPKPKATDFDSAWDEAVLGE